MSFSTVCADGFVANIYWDFGGDVTQYGSPRAIGRLVELQTKVVPLLFDCDRIVADELTGYACRPSHLGCHRYLHPRLGPSSLHSHILQEIFSHDMLCSPWRQRCILRRHHLRRISGLPTNLIQLGSLNTRWPLWKSSIAGPIHWRF